MEPQKGLSLARTARGQSVVVKQFGNTGRDALRLRELGLGEGRQVSVLSGSDPLLCVVNGTRIGLNRRLAEEILVEVTP